MHLTGANDRKLGRFLSKGVKVGRAARPGRALNRIISKEGARKVRFREQDASRSNSSSGASPLSPVPQKGGPRRPGAGSSTAVVAPAPAGAATAATSSQALKLQAAEGSAKGGIGRHGQQQGAKPAAAEAAAAAAAPLEGLGLVGVPALRSALKSNRQPQSAAEKGREDVGAASNLGGTSSSITIDSSAGVVTAAGTNSCRSSQDMSRGKSGAPLLPAMPVSSSAANEGRAGNMPVALPAAAAVGGGGSGGSSARGSKTGSPRACFAAACSGGGGGGGASGEGGMGIPAAAAAGGLTAAGFGGNVMELFLQMGPADGGVEGPGEGGGGLEGDGSSSKARMNLAGEAAAKGCRGLQIVAESRSRSHGLQLWSGSLCLRFGSLSLGW